MQHDMVIHIVYLGNGHFESSNLIGFKETLVCDREQDVGLLDALLCLVFVFQENVFVIGDFGIPGDIILGLGLSRLAQTVDTHEGI
jgi:hypothetical protein